MSLLGSRTENPPCMRPSNPTGQQHKFCATWFFPQMSPPQSEAECPPTSDLAHGLGTGGSPVLPTVCMVEQPSEGPRSRAGPRLSPGTVWEGFGPGRAPSKPRAGTFPGQGQPSVRDSLVPERFQAQLRQALLGDLNHVPFPF